MTLAKFVILAIPATFATIVTSEIAVILATPVNSATLAISETSGSQCHPAVRRHGRLPRGSLQVQRDSSRRSLGHNPRCPNRRRQLNLHGALSMVRQASCSK